MKQYMQQHGTSYYVANWFFPSELRDDVFALYAFVRIPDDVVDGPAADPVLARQELDEMWRIFVDVYAVGNEQNTTTALNPLPLRGSSPLSGGDSADWQNVSREMSRLCHQYEIPLEWVEDFFAAMYADLDQKVYRTYEDLQGYMYGSAEVIGLMMCKLIGYDESQEQEVWRTAKLLGEAMQYTNFLRDISEDLLEYDRIYMPEDRLVQHDLNHILLTQYVQGKPVDERWQTFVSAQVLQCKELYREANKGIQLLHPQGRRAVLVASRMYESILDKIIRNDYDSLTRTARTTKFEKLRTLFSHTIRYAMGTLD